MAVYVFPPVNANVTITGGATEATLLDVEQNTLDTVSELQTLNAVDFATQATSEAIEVNTYEAAQNTANILAIDFATEDKQDTQITSLSNIDTSLNNIEADIDQMNAKIPAGLVPTAFDYISLTYVGATTDIQTVTYKSGGSGGTTVATLTLVYDGSNRLTSVTKA